MPQESYGCSIFNSPGKNYRGLKGLIYYNNSDSCNNNNKDDDASSYAEEIISDSGLAHRKAEEAARRRYEAAQWLRRMDHSASEVLSDHPTEEEFCLALRNGLILCNVLNKINPGAVHKVVENPVVDVQATEGAAQSAIQYFENMRNFLVAVAKMKLLTFEASHIEKGGSSAKVVDCILCLKGYYEWKLSGGIGVWRYGGMIKITSFPKESSSSAVTSESADDSLDDSESSHFYDQLTDFLHLSIGSLNESKEANVTAFMFDHFSLGLLRAYLEGTNEFDDELPLSAMAIEIMLRNIVKNFSSLFLSQSNQLGIFFKKVLNSDCISPTKSQFLETISKYLSQRSNLVSRDIASFCICGGRKCGTMWCDNISSSGGRELLDLQQKQLEALKALFREAKQEVHQAQLGWENEFQWLGDHVKGLQVAASSYHKVLEENRMLYNQVQDLKGTIRVYCRVRPFLQGGNGQSAVDYIGENGSIMIVNPQKQGREARKVFTFNKVFGTNVTQQQIYEDTQPLVRSVLDGYNVCIFAYGQTGSGKTYTMSGPDLMTEETWGVNYRALRDLFDISKARNNVVEYEVGVQMIEIYNEQVRDLLVSDGSNRRLDIRNNSQLNGLNVPDASLIPVNCTEDVLDLMRIGQTNRAVGATALNERSSRSHSILTVHVRGRELVSGSILKGCLHLVDLAGSERVNKSEAVGERLKEAQHINRSLSALGDVIAALAQKNSHVPYRNSKLTQVLQDSLGGHAKTLMFVHINPEVNAIGETISTMKFAERVATIDLGAAQSNKETNEIRDFKEEISNLKSTLEKKEAELEQLKIKATNRGVISPLRMPKHDNNNACSKPEINQPPVDTQNTAGRSCSSGKQRRSKFPSSKFTDKDPSPKVSFLIEEMLQDSAKPRSPSPPIKRSTSTDRAFHTRLKVKPDQFENSPLTKLPFPSSVTINRSTARVPSHLPPSVSSTRNPEEPPFRDPFSGLERVTIRKVKPEVEEERFKQVCNVRHKTISKQNSTKFKIKNDSSVATSFQKLKVSEALLLSDKDHPGKMREEESRKVDSVDHDKEHVVPLKLPTNGTNSRTMKLHRTFSRNSQNVEPRELIQAEDQQVNKHSNAVTANGKESINLSAPELRRSRSTPRGKFVL